MTSAALVSTICDKCGHSLNRPDIRLRTSPFPTLLGKNHCLPAPQADIVRSTIFATLADVSQLDNQILRLQAVVEELKRKRQDLQTYVNEHKVLVAPMMRFPSEILSEIFVRCVGTGWPDDDFELDTAPLTCASICSKWRNVALITPRLWSSISLRLAPQHIKRHMNLVRLWLSRAAYSPLSINLQADSYQNDMRQLTDIFISKSDCWQKVNLSLPLPILKSLGPARNRLPLLECLHIWLREARSSETIDTFACAPRLRVCNLGPRVFPISFIAPWNQLREVDLPNIVSAQRPLDIMALTSNVERCQLEFTSYQISTIISHQPRTVQLVQLQSLTIRVLTVSVDIPSFLAALHLPGMRDFSLSAVRKSWESTSITQLSDLLSHSKLQKLAFQSSNSRPKASGDAIIKILAATPELQELQLLGDSISCMDDVFLAHFGCIADSETPVLVPKLQTFSFRYDPDTRDVDFVALTNAMVSRALPHGESQIVTILCHQPVKAPKLDDSSTLARWDQLREAGLDVRIIRDEEPSIF